MGFPLFVVCAF